MEMINVVAEMQHQVNLRSSLTLPIRTGLCGKALFDRELLCIFELSSDRDLLIDSEGAFQSCVEDKLEL